MASEELILKLKKQIIEYLNLMDMQPEDIEADEPLFGPDSNIALDSIDAIELSVLLEREYGLKITDSKQGKKIMGSVGQLADFITENQKA
ncbi:phosphopantetheine-binding protein [Fulvivirga maritima]|uniref:phosphopantetheine-binding protein n=1 Tax=Fulvivirga maritima TaxID=2904247 RepID=UPI001F17ACC9|nr:phosphopantetheine-binding protein [Fulvivirga maritima]UII27330.1 phosphopantetheine-binding protein [Fulvivirga maritima]